MCALKSVDPLKEILFCDNMDKVCINLLHNIKVFFKGDNSIMMKNFSNNNCIAVGCEPELDKTRMFSLHRDGINVYHNSSDCLSAEIIDDNCSSSNDMCTAHMRYAHGRFSTVATMSNSNQRMINNNFKYCEDVFNQSTRESIDKMKTKALMLIKTCVYKKGNDGETQFRFLNGLDVQQYPTGHTTVSFCDHNATLIMNPTGTVFFSLDNAIIMSTNSQFYAKKGTAILTAVDRKCQAYIVTEH